MKVCLTGGIACGKSLLSRFLRELGVATIDADDVVHELIPDPAERKRIAAEVFSDPVKRKALEARLHPLVRARLADFLSRPHPSTHNAHPTPHTQTPKHSNTHQPPLSLAIIPLLFEVHWESDYDIIACVISPRDQQIERMMTTRGYTRQEAEARLAAQLPVEEKAAKSHYVIRNEGSAEDLRKEAVRFVAWLKRQAGA